MANTFDNYKDELNYMANGGLASIPHMASGDYVPLAANTFDWDISDYGGNYGSVDADYGGNLDIGSSLLGSGVKSTYDYGANWASQGPQTLLGRSSSNTKSLDTRATDKAAWDAYDASGGYTYDTGPANYGTWDTQYDNTSNFSPWTANDPYYSGDTSMMQSLAYDRPIDQSWTYGDQTYANQQQAMDAYNKDMMTFEQAQQERGYLEAENRRLQEEYQKELAKYNEDMAAYNAAVQNQGPPPPGGTVDNTSKFINLAGVGDTSSGVKGPTSAERLAAERAASGTGTGTGGFGSSGYGSGSGSSGAGGFGGGNTYNEFNPIEDPLSALVGSFAHGGEVNHPAGHVDFMSEGGLNNRYVQGAGDGTSDDVPAMLAQGEFVIPADVVASLGNGDNESGASVLNSFMKVVREHKTSNGDKGLPPDSKGPLEYIQMAKRKA